MINLNTVLKDGSPRELSDFVSSCANNEDLVAKLEKDPARLFSFVQNMKTEGNEQLTTRLSTFLYKLSPEQLENPEIKKMETLLRNRGILNRNTEPDIALRQDEVVSPPFKAHKAILALESPYFRGVAGFNDQDFQKGQILIKQMGISPWVYEKALDYLYASDEDRKNLVSTIDKSLLPDMAKLAEYWQIEGLKAQCDEELCNSIGQLTIEKSDLPGWLAQSQFTPKFVMLLEFLAKQAGQGDLDSLIEQMQNPNGASQLAAKCTTKEIALFSTLKTEFGKACRIPAGTIGKAEWEKAFPVTIPEVPPLPANIHAILEQKDPWEPDKKLKDTCQLFLSPAKVIFHGERGNRDIFLNCTGLQMLVDKATNSSRRMRFDRLDFNVITKMDKMWEPKSAWVLMRKEAIPNSKNLDFSEQRRLLNSKGNFAVPKSMDAILMHILTFENEGKFLPKTHCHDQIWGLTAVGGGVGSEMYNTSNAIWVSFGSMANVGTAAVWEFK